MLERARARKSGRDGPYPRAQSASPVRSFHTCGDNHRIPHECERPLEAGFVDHRVDLHQADRVGQTALLKRVGSPRVEGSNTAAMTRTTERPTSVAVTTRSRT
jgi:hypothetical protein